MALRRKHPRAPLLTQVEAQGQTAVTLGRTSDIGVGGLLIETPETLAEGATVVVRFFVPPGPTALEAAGRVVRCQPGKSMAIAFLGLPEGHRRRILDYIRRVQGGPSENLPLEPEASQPRQRRSARIPRRVAVVLSWQDEEGHPRQEAAETQRLSRNGAMLLAFNEFTPGSLVRMSVPDTGQEGLTRVVWTAAAEVPGRIYLGVEVMGRENLWGIDFPRDWPPEAEPPRIARRRSARLPRRIDVVLNWVDEYGRVREEEGHTQMLSQHGAAVTLPVTLPVRQRFRFRIPEREREVEAHVVWARPNEVPGRTDLGVEFLGTDNFWGILFPPDPGSPLKH
ncbi:MAG: PilZ domain-containing protein [Terriglobia bacterium]